MPALRPWKANRMAGPPRLAPRADRFQIRIVCRRWDETTERPAHSERSGSSRKLPGARDRRSGGGARESDGNKPRMVSADRRADRCASGRHPSARRARHATTVQQQTSFLPLWHLQASTETEGAKVSGKVRSSGGGRSKKERHGRVTHAAASVSQGKGRTIS